MPKAIKHYTYLCPALTSMTIVQTIIEVSSSEMKDYLPSPLAMR